MQKTAAAKAHINKIQRMQNKFLRIILNKPYDTPLENYTLPQTSQLLKNALITHLQHII